MTSAQKCTPASASVEQLLNQATASHRAGNLQEAENLYHAILQIEPFHPDANHNLGTLSLQANNPFAGLPFFRTALECKPEIAQYWLSYIDALIQANQHDRARQVLAEGRQKGLSGAGADELDVRLAGPSQYEVESLLALFAQREYARAEESARELTARFPYNGFGWKVLGAVLVELGRHPDALESMQRAAELLPLDAEAHSNLGNTLKELGRYAESEASCRRALEINPDYAGALGNLGNALKEQWRLLEAETCYRRALEINPLMAEAHNNLGSVIRELSRLEGAEASFRRALEINPEYPEAHSNLGNTLKDMGHLQQAEVCYRRALEINPNFAEAHNNLGNTLKDLDRLEEAEVCYRRALEAKYNCSAAYNNLLYFYAFTRMISPVDECRLASGWEAAMLSEAERSAARRRALSLENAFGNLPLAGRKLKLGVVSAELHQHSVAEFFEPLLEHFDRARLHVTLYPTTSGTDARTEHFKELADQFIPLYGLSDQTAAERIRSDRIDVLIDTTAHMNNSRLGIFAHRAAPVQCHYIGYHGTTGLTEMDWFIADNELLPPSCDDHFREGIWRLPRLWIAYRADTSLPVSGWQPDSSGTIRLGSFNNLTKVRTATLQLWARTMKAIPGSLLLLKDRKAGDNAVQQRILRELKASGIAEERVEFASNVPDWNAHMALYDRLDIALDAIPLNSGTTAFDALWMGVPMVAIEGDWMGARMTSTVLKALGKPEWVARDEDEYVAKVAALAADVEGRRALRYRQRELVASSQLCDAHGLAAALEDAFEEMFERWQG